MPKENADALKAKYNLTDEALQELMSGLKANRPSVPVEEEGEEEQAPESMPQIFSKIGKGETSLGDAIVLIDFQDRREARRKERQSNLTPETITNAVVEGVKQALGGKPPQSEEMPAWAKKIQDDLNEIKSREEKKEEETRLQQTVEKAVEPLRQDLKTTQDELAKTKEGLKEPKPPPAKGELETTKETLQALQEIDELRGKPKMPEKSKEVMIDLNEEIATALGDELKKAVVDAVHEKISGEKEEGAPPVTTTAEGKVQIDWYNLGQRILKTVDKFIEKLPVAAPPKMPVKEMPPPSKPPQLPTPPPTAPVTPPPAPPTSTAPITPTPQPTPPTAPAPITQTPPVTPPEAPTTVETTPPREVATATEEEEKPTPQEEPQPQPPEERKTEKEPQPTEEKPEPPKLEEKPKKNEEKKEEAEKTEKTIIAESTTKESVVEQETSESGGSEETVHGGSVTEKGRREPTESD